MLKLARGKCSSCLLRCTQEDDKNSGTLNKTLTPREGKCKALETKGDTLSDHLTTMLEQ